MKDKETRRTEGEARNAAYRALTLEQKLERATNPPYGASARQVARLQAALAKKAA